MITASDIVAEGRGWIGTRFQHQGRVKKTPSHKGGVDCLGLLIGIAGALGLQGYDRRTQERIPIVALDSLFYGHRPEGDRLQAVLSRWLEPVDQLQPADILLCRFDGNPQHLALATPYAADGLGMLHAYAQARSVVEHALDDAWQDRIVQCYRLL